MTEKNHTNIEICNALKLALKARKMSYRELAEKIEVSEKTIKRLFKDYDCSLSRLSLICDVIGLSVYELLDFSKNYSEPLTQLSQEQEIYLQHNPSTFCLFIFPCNGL